MYTFGSVPPTRILFEWKYLTYDVNFDGESISNIKNGFDITVLSFFGFVDLRGLDNTKLSFYFLRTWQTFQIYWCPEVYFLR